MNLAGNGFAWGTVGWQDDGGVFLVPGSETDDGNTLVRVTLFRNRDAATELDASQAQGDAILCQLARHVGLLARGERVMVAIPEPHGRLPGGSCIVAAVDANWQANSNLGPGEHVWQIPGCPARFMLRAATKTQPGGFFVFVRDTQGNDSGLAVTPDGFKYFHPAGVMNLDGDGWRARHVSGGFISLYGLANVPAPFSSLASCVKMSAAFAYVDGTSVQLGPQLPGNVFLPAACGPDPGPGPLLVAGIKSASVKLSAA